MKITSITAYDSTPIVSEKLPGECNHVYSDWAISTFFKIKEGLPTAIFMVRDKLFGGNILFETNDYKDLEKWIEEHSDELQKQINNKKVNK